MSYNQSSTSFYENSFGGAQGGYGVSLSGGSQESAQGVYSSHVTASTKGVDETLLGTGGNFTSESYSASVTGGLDQSTAAATSLANAGTSGNYYASAASFGGSDQQSFVDTSSSATSNGYSSNSFEQQSSSSTTSYATNAQGLFNDPNPQVIRRPAASSPQTYSQRVMIRFLQPPPVSPPGPLIIKEVRPPQPPPPPPLYIRQRPPPPPLLPPIVIREAPPKMPPPVGTQVITKVLPPLPVPPRSVIIERLPPVPPKPREIIVERWLPYRTQQKRRVIIQRAPPPVVQKPRNIIIYYEPPKTQVVRRFVNLGVERVNPTEYVARYGTQLEDSASLVTHARQAGVVEDITPPHFGGSNVHSSNYATYQSSSTDFDNSTYGMSNDASILGNSGYSVNTGAEYNFGNNANYSVGGSGSYGVSGNTNYGVNGNASYGGSGNASYGVSSNAVENTGHVLSGNTGGFSSSSYESSGSYGATVSSSGEYLGGVESQFGGLSLLDNSNGLVGTSSNYESYSSQTYSSP